jgi:hypothetical protein
MCMSIVNRRLLALSCFVRVHVTPTSWKIWVGNFYTTEINKSCDGCCVTVCVTFDAFYQVNDLVGEGHVLYYLMRSLRML